MRYLAMRAKKMTARKDRLPNVAELRANFIKKGTEITPKESEILLEAVREHRIAKRAKVQSKPKETKSKPSSPRTYSRSYGKT